MSVYQLAFFALLALTNFYGFDTRSIEEVDNSIEASSGNDQAQSAGLSSTSLQPTPRTRFGTDWIKFTKLPPVKVYQNLGSPVEISCEVMGSQIPSIQWVVGHLPLSEIETLESNMISDSNTNAIVKVRSVHIIDHMLSQPRTYTCVGSTGSKQVYASTIVYPQSDLKDLVHVREKPFVGQIRPRIIYNEIMHLDLVGSNVVVPCKVHARPRADVYWMNDDGALISQNQRYKLLPSGDLLISDLKWEDMGTYKCIARNVMGKDTAEVFVYPVLKDRN